MLNAPDATLGDLRKELAAVHNLLFQEVDKAVQYTF